MGKIVKEFDNVKLTVEDGKREVVGVISTDAIDRDNEIVKPSGMRKKAYQGNPVVLVNHDYQSLPVGKSLWVKSGTDNGKEVLIAKTYISDKTEMARDVFSLLQEGILNAFSIGFNTIRSTKPTTAEINARPELKNVALIHREWELLEYSIVGVPANQEALTLAVSKGYSPKTIDFISGKTAAEAKAADEITEEVKQEVKQIKRHVITENDVLRILAKKLDTIQVGVNVDNVYRRAVKNLTV